MRITDSRTSLSVVKTAAKKSAAPTGTGELCASRIILTARAELRDLLLKDDLAYSGSLLLGPVAEDLDRITIELDSLAGQQKLFELWIDCKEEEST
jgi:hypothetical protein